MRFGRSDPPDDNTPVTPDPASDAAAELARAEAEAEAAEATATAARARADEVRLSKLKAAEADVDADADADADVDVDAETTTEAPDPAETVPRPGHTRRPTSTLRLITGTLIVLMIGALVTVSALMVIGHRDVQADQRREAEYAAAARQSVVTLMSLDFTSVDEDVQRIIDNSTGDFRKEFEAQAKDFATVAKESKVITEVTATASAVESMTDDDAVVLVTATSTVTNAAGAKQDPRNWRLTVNLTRDGEQIKMSKVEFAP